MQSYVLYANRQKYDSGISQEKAFEAEYGALAVLLNPGGSLQL